MPAEDDELALIAAARFTRLAGGSVAGGEAGKGVEVASLDRTGSTADSSTVEGVSCFLLTASFLLSALAFLLLLSRSFLHLLLQRLGASPWVLPAATTVAGLHQKEISSSPH